MLALPRSLEDVGRVRAAVTRRPDIPIQENLPRHPLPPRQSHPPRSPANLKLPLRDGDIDRPEDEAYADSYFFNANSPSKE